MASVRDLRGRVKRRRPKAAGKSGGALGGRVALALEAQRDRTQRTETQVALRPRKAAQVERVQFRESAVGGERAVHGHHDDLGPLQTRHMRVTHRSRQELSNAASTAKGGVDVPEPTIHPLESLL